MALFADAIANLRGKPIPKGSGDYGYSPYLYAVNREGSVTLADGLSTSYSSIYRKQPWVYAAVNILARSVARTPIKAYSGPSTDRAYLTDGTLHDLLAHPWQGGIPFRLKERTVKDVAIYGNAITIKLGMTDPSSPPTEIIPAPAIGWVVGENDTYIYTNPKNGERYPVPRYQVIHTRFWDCDESGFGMSMLEPLRVQLAVEDGAQRLASAAFRNGARPANVLATDQKMDQKAIDRLKEQMVAIHGGVDNAFKLAVLDSGLGWSNPPVVDMEDAAVVPHRKITREEVAAVFGVPQPTIGVLDEANFASIDMFHTMLYQDAIGPWFKLIEETWQSELVDVTDEWAKLTIEFDSHGLMRGSTSDQYRNYATALSAGFMTANEVRQRENLPPSPQPEANALRFPLNAGTGKPSGAPGAQLAEDTGQPDSTSAIHQNGAAVHA